MCVRQGERLWFTGVKMVTDNRLPVYDCIRNSRDWDLVESTDTTEGNGAAVERAALVDEITDDIAVIDEMVTLEDALAEVRYVAR